VVAAQKTRRKSDTLSALDVANLLRPTVARLARRLRQQDHTGFGPTMTAALASIAKHGGPTHGELAAIERLAPPTITSLVDKLVALGFVTREIDAADRRVTRVRATPAGLEQLDAVRNRRTSWLAEQLDTLSTEELRTLAEAAEILGALVERVDEAH
jgi:DNA-binding MarR family transcriptional regulator